MRWTSMIVAAAMALSVGLAGAAELPDLKGRKIAVGTAADYQPYAFLADDGKTPQGWDIDFVTEACKRLKAECSFQIISWDVLIQAVRDGQYDIGTDGITINDERRQAVDFSAPYLHGESRMLVKAGETRFSDAKGFTAAKDARVAVVVGTTQFYTAVATFFGGRQDDPRMVQFDGFNTALLALQSGDVDMVLTDGVNAGRFVEASGGKLKVLAEALAPEDFGLIFAKGSDLVAPFDAAIAAMKADGTFKALDDKWLAAKK